MSVNFDIQQLRRTKHSVKSMVARGGQIFGFFSREIMLQKSM